MWRAVQYYNTATRVSSTFDVYRHDLRVELASGIMPANLTRCRALPLLLPHLVELQIYDTATEHRALYGTRVNPCAMTNCANMQLLITAPLCRGCISTFRCAVPAFSADLLFSTIMGVNIQIWKPIGETSKPTILDNACFC